MDGILPVLPVIGSGTGWAAFVFLVLYVVRQIIGGNLITKREAEYREQRIISLESANKTLLDQNTVLIETTKPWRAAWDALTQGGE